MLVTLICTSLVVVWWLYRDGPRTAITGTAVAYLVTCIFNSVTLPWYYAAGLVLVGAFGPSKRVRNFTILASLFISLSFTGSGNTWLYRWSWDALIAVVSVWMFFVIYRRARSGALRDPFDDQLSRVDEASASASSTSKSETLAGSSS